MPKSSLKSQSHQVETFICITTIFVLLLAFGLFRQTIINENKKVLGAFTQNVLAKNDEIYYQLKYWIDLTNKNPNYQAGWIELGKISITTANNDLLKKVTENLQRINPNLDEVVEFKRYLDKK